MKKMTKLLPKAVKARFKLLGFIPLLLILFSSFNAYGQLTIKGVVADSLGKPLPGVSVILSGGKTGTQTIDNGTFTLTVPKESATGFLEFSLVGYQKSRIALNGQNYFQVMLSLDPTAMSDIVVVAYGTQKKTSLTGAVSVVGAKELEGRPVTSVTQALQGAAPGLIIQQNTSEPGAPISINIRGVGTLGSASPLIVVDGIPSSLDILNPNDIESISVLKDAASAALYGSRSANGVILVTTKKGRRGSKPVISYNGIYGIQKPTMLVKPVEGYEYMQLKNEALVNSGNDPQFTPEDIQQAYTRGSEDWWLNKVLQSSVPQQNHNLSISGSSGVTNYLFSGGIVNQSSLYNGPDYGVKRYNLRTNLNTQIGNHFKIGTSLAFTRQNMKEHAFWSEWIISTALRIPRIYPIMDTSGNYTIVPTASNNPLAWLEKGGERNYLNDNFLLNLNGEYAFNSHLSLKAIYGGNYTQNRTNEFRKIIDYKPYIGSDNQNSVTDANSNSRSDNLQAMLNYENVFGAHGIKALVGYSSEGGLSSYTQLHKTDVDNITGEPVTGTKIDEGGSYNLHTDRWALNSVFGRANYAFRDRYLVEFNFRVDASSRFAEENRRAFFPSVSAGWKLTDESFMQSIREKVGSLKLRASWGQLGNQEIGLYRYLNTWSTYPNVYGFGNAGQAASFLGMGNPDIRWETSTMTNLGADVTLFNNRLSITYDYFNKVTDDILLDLPAPSLFGAWPPTQNAGKVKNKGWEFQASYRFGNGAFKHNVSFNLSDNLNEVMDIKGKVFMTEADRTFITKEGFPISSYYGLQSNGFYQSLEDIKDSPKPTFVNEVHPGDIKYVDRNQDGKIDNNDRYIMGNPFPRYTFGFNYGLTWKGFDAYVLVQGVGKRTLYLRGEGVEAFHNNWDDVYKQHLDRWTPTNPDASYPRLTTGAASTNNNAGSDFWLLNAAYARLKNLQLGYSLPAHLLKPVGIEKCRFYVTGQNLFTLTKMNNGFDPEITELNSSLQISNSNSNSGRVYPTLKVIAVGVDVNF
ncbi:MAG TPA: TonB-dependent receptor [Flavisolibacter sp.]|nr:TonB-dependent receptor [Flavisolibacter sp.]